MRNPPSDYPQVAVMILNYNGEKYLSRCVESVLKTNYPNFRIILIDNNSSDNSVDEAEKLFPEVEIIRNTHDDGFGEAYNKTISDIEDPYVAILNNDVVVEPSWLRNLMKHMIDPDVAAVVPKLLLLSEPRCLNSAGGMCDIFGVGWNRGNGEPDVGKYEGVEDVFYGPGAVLVIKKKVYELIGGFDGRYFAYAEDLDWCWRARLHGYRILYVPFALCYHEGAGSWRRWRGTVAYLLERNWLATALKNYSLRSLLKIIPRYLAIKGSKTAWSIYRGRTDELQSWRRVLMAIHWNMMNIRQTLSDRVRVQTLRRIQDSEIVKMMYQQSFEVNLALGLIKHPFFPNGIKL